MKTMDYFENAILNDGLTWGDINFSELPLLTNVDKNDIIEYGYMFHCIHDSYEEMYAKVKQIYEDVKTVVRVTETNKYEIYIR